MFRLKRLSDLSAGSGLSRIISIVAFAAACMAMFVIPWFFPRTQPVLGESYALGFNNRLAVVGLCVVIIAAAVARLFCPNVAEDARKTLGWFANDGWQALFNASKLEYVILGLFCFFMTQFILWWDGILVIPYWGEADYFLSRIDLVALGYQPYTDFHYLYGPLQLYCPLWLDRATAGIIGIEAAYTYFVVAETVLGCCCLFIFLKALSVAEWSKPWVLLLSLIIWLPLSMGLQYAPLRFTAVPCAIVMLQAAHRRSQSTIAGQAILFCASTIGLATALMLSPEMGIVFAASVTAFAGVLAMRRDWPGFVTCATSVTVVATVVQYLLPDYLRGLKAFAAGAMNFPIYPNLHNMLIAGVATYALSKLAVAAIANPWATQAPLAAAIGGASALLLAPSLGRCDPGHVMINSLMLLLLMFPASIAFGRQGERAWLATFAVLFVLLNQVSYWGHYWPNFKQALAIADFYEKNPATVLSWKDSWDKRREEAVKGSLLNWKRTVPFPDWANREEMLHKGVSLPLSGDIGLERYVKLQPNFRPSFHPVPKPDIHGPSDVERAVADVSKETIAILPEWAVATATSNQALDRRAYERQTSHFLSGLMIYPLSCVAVNEPFVPEIELCRRVMAASTVVGTGAGVVVVRTKNTAGEDTEATK